MIQKKFGLTLRQTQALISIAYRNKNLGIVKLSNLITDMGVSFATLADHLNALYKTNYIYTINNKKPRNLNFSEEIFITASGEKHAELIMKSINASYSDSSTSIFNKIKKSFEPRTVQLNLNNTKTASFAKAFEQLIKKNPSEPVLTSIAMYTDLDSQLNLMRVENKEKYVQLSRAKLNLEIRNGRLASIAIPTAIRGTTRLSDLKEILGDTWSWMGTVGSTSNRRYWQEAMSLGLLQIQGNLLTSMKPTTVDTISWLANKTYFTFANTIPSAPKSSLVVFKESFNFPSEEDIMKPQNADMDLQWLNFIRDSMGNKDDYLDAIREGLKIIKNDANIVQEYEGKIMPSTIIRKVNSEPDLEKSFKTILKQSDSDMFTGKILLAITAKPGITIYELYKDLNAKNKRKKITIEDVEDTASLLIANNLVQLTTSNSTSKDFAKLYSFVHLPFFTSKMTGNKETNAVLRSMKPYLLQKIKELFETETEKTAAYGMFNDLMINKDIYFEDIESQYGKIISRKSLILVEKLSPFVSLKKDYSGFNLDEKNKGLSDIIINSLQYSMLTQDESLGMYNQAISDIIEKDKPFGKEVAEESKILVNEIIKNNIKTGF